MTPYGRKRLYEIGITSVIAHRLAHTVVQEGIRVDTPMFQHMAHVHVIECKDILTNVLGLDAESTQRILQYVVDKAESEVATFEILGQFTTHGATSVRLEVVLEPMIETLMSM